MTNNSETMANKVVSKLVELKAQDIVVMNIIDLTIIADYFVVCTARNDAHMNALKKDVLDMMEEIEIFAKKAEGTSESGWILIDWKDVILHIFKETEREFYDLERVWGDSAMTRIDADTYETPSV